MTSRGLRLVCAVFALSLAAIGTQVGSAAARSVTTYKTDGYCRAGGSVPAFACDPSRKARDLVLSLGSIRSTSKRTAAVIDSNEPLLPRETVTLSWAHPSKRARLVINVLTPSGPRQVIFALYW